MSSFDFHTHVASKISFTFYFFFKSYFSVTEMLMKLALRQYKYFVNFVYRLI